MLAVEVDRGLHGPVGGALPRHHLDQRQHLRRVERVADQQPLGGAHLPREVAGHERRGRGGDQRALGHDRLDAGEQLLLERQPLGGVLLDDVGTADGVLDVGRAPRSARAARRGRRPASGLGAGELPHRVVDLAADVGPRDPAPAPTCRARRTASPTTARWCPRRSPRRCAAPSHGASPALEPVPPPIRAHPRPDGDRSATGPRAGPRAAPPAGPGGCAPATRAGRRSAPR